MELEHSLQDLFAAGSSLFGCQKRLFIKQHKVHYLNDIACLQLHNGRWLGDHYDWRFARNNRLTCFSTRSIPRVRESITALPTDDRPRAYLNFSGPIADDEVDAGYVWLIDLMPMSILRWDPNSIVVDLAGKSIRGRFSLQRDSGNKFIMMRSS